MTKRAPTRTTRRTSTRGRSGAPASRRTAKTTPARNKRRTGRAGIHISAAQVAYGAGVMLLGVALITLLSVLDEGRGAFGEWWVTLLTRALGWGRFAVPLVLVIPSLWLLTRLSGEPLALPWKRLAGGLLMLVTLLGLAHHLSIPSSTDLAEASRGGLLGAAISSALQVAFGWSGAVVVFVLILTLALTVTLDLSLEEIVRDSVSLGKRIWGWLSAVAGTGQTSPSLSETPRTAPVIRVRNRAQAKASAQVVTPVQTAVSSPVGSASAQAEPSGRESMTKGEPASVPSPAASRPTPQEVADVPDVSTYEARRWALPPVEDILALDDESPMSLRDIREKTRIIEETLLSLGVPVAVVEVNPGPVVTQFGLEPGYVERQDRKGKVKRMKVQVAKIASLSNDIALALAASPIRIEAPVPGKGIVGIEVPNKETAMVGLRSVMESDEFRRQGQRSLMAAFGRDVSGLPVVDDLASLPHLLIAGATGSGKSVCINAIIACLLCRNTPEDLRLLMVDPKRVELSNYNGIPHLITPVVVEAGRVVGVLKWLAAEMDRRYQLFSDAGARNLESYNKKMIARGSPHLPNIVMFIDELADLMMVAPDEVERHICRIAQLSRATGIHLVIATQRPSVDVVTGLIKANFPARLSFLVSSQVDSRVILDTPGADKLLGSGDALYMAPDSPKLARIQGCYVSDGELERIISFWKSQNTQPETHREAEPVDPGKTVQKPLWPSMPNMNIEETLDTDDNSDPLLSEATDLVIRHGKASVSFLQRSLRIGYSRAARMIDTLEEQGIIGPPTGTSKARQVRATGAESGNGDAVEDDDYE